MNTIVKIAVGILIIGGLGFFGYKFFFASTPENVLGVDAAPGEASSPEVAEMIKLINELRSLQVDTSIFSDPAFLSLKDYSVELVPQPVGRKNPFAPIGN